MYSKLFLQLLRPKVAIMLVLFVCLGMASTTHSVTVSNRFVILLLTLSAWYVNATSVNDLADEKIDVINLKSAKGRPLVDHSASRKSVIVMAVMSGLMALCLSTLVSGWFIWIMLGGVMLSLVYSLPPIRISYRGIVAPLLLPIGYVAIPFIGGHMLSPGMLDVSLLAACYAGFVGRIILKDFRDIVGDTKYGKRTFVVRHGKQMTCILSFSAWVIANVLFWLAVTNIVWFVLQPIWLLIVHGLYKLSNAKKFRDEQVIIGLMARLANGLLIAILGYLITVGPVQLQVTAALAALFCVTHIYALKEFEQVEIAYRG